MAQRLDTFWRRMMRDDLGTQSRIPMKRASLGKCDEGKSNVEQNTADEYAAECGKPIICVVCGFPDIFMMWSCRVWMQCPWVRTLDCGWRCDRVSVCSCAFYMYDKLKKQSANWNRCAFCCNCSQFQYSIQILVVDVVHFVQKTTKKKSEKQKKNKKKITKVSMCVMIKRHVCPTLRSTDSNCRSKLVCPNRLANRSIHDDDDVPTLSWANSNHCFQVIRPIESTNDSFQVDCRSKPAARNQPTNHLANQSSSVRQIVCVPTMRSDDSTSRTDEPVRVGRPEQTTMVAQSMHRFGLASANVCHWSVSVVFPSRLAICSNRATSRFACSSCRPNLRSWRTTMAACFRSSRSTWKVRSADFEEIVRAVVWTTCRFGDSGGNWSMFAPKQVDRQKCEKKKFDLNPERECKWHLGFWNVN